MQKYLLVTFFGHWDLIDFCVTTENLTLTHSLLKEIKQCVADGYQVKIEQRVA